MKKQFRILPFLFLALFSLTASGQYYDIGQSPASIKWEKLEAGNFSIIYPSTYYQKAKEAAYLFSISGKSVASGLDTKPKLTPIILHTQNAVSNAYSIWAPRRIEVLTTPPQDLYAQPWMQQLALHEYRHIVQLSSLNQGFTKFLGYLFGQQAVVVSTGIFVPSWFIEGDAVATETALSFSGRGRVPSFSQPLRAQLAGKGAYSFPKATLGSYRDFVPDVYTLGYHIVAASRQKYGLEIWSEAMRTVARQPWSITPFNHGLKKKTGLNKKGLYTESLKTLDSLWRSNTSTEINHIRLSEEPDCFTSYQHPYRINDSVIVALKTSLKDVPKIVSINKQGIERQIHTPGYIMDELISYNGNYLAWAEYRPHIRWETVGFTDIVLFQPETGSKLRLTLKGRFFAPVVSPDGNQIAAVGYQESGECFIALIRDNKLNNEIQIPDGLHAASPAWSNNGKELVFVATGNQGKALAMLSIESGITEFLTPFSYSEISNPFVDENEIYYTAAVEGKSQLCMLNVENGTTFQVTNTSFGADQVSVTGESLVFADYTSDGYRICSLPLPGETDLKEKPADTYNWPLAEAISAQETTFRFTDSIPDVAFKRSDYKKAEHLFGIHSWAPVFIDIGGETARPGASVMSQNLLSTLFITAGYEYNMDEEAGMFKSEIAWKGWFPIIKATLSQGNRASAAILQEGQAPERFTWSETNLDLSISQQLNLSKGRINSGIIGETSYNFSNIVHDNSTPDRFIEGILSGLTYRTFAYLYKRRAYRDLAPPLGLNLDLKFRHTPFGDLKAGNIFALQSQIFLPGIFANHSIQLYAGFQTANPEQYRFSNIISTSRGYHSEMTGNELISLKAAYRLPLIYPDFNIGGLLYIKRFRAGIFHEFTRTSGHTPTAYYNSTGMDLVADFHLFGLSTPISTGIRTIYREKYNDLSSSLLLSVNLYEY